MNIQCKRVDCLHWSNDVCQRDEILVDFSKQGDAWICRCFSEKGTGHLDWSRFIGQTPTHLTDREANGMIRDRKNNVASRRK